MNLISSFFFEAPSNKTFIKKVDYLDFHFYRGRFIKSGVENSLKYPSNSLTEPKLRLQ